MLLLVFFFFFFVKGELLLTTDIRRGGKLIELVYPRNDPQSCTYHVAQITSNLDTIIIPLKEGSNGYLTQTCMNTVSTVYITFPKGCDNSLITHNCPTKSADAVREELQDTWMDKYGPVFIADSQSTRLLSQIESEGQLARATMAYVVNGGIPPFGAVRLTTFVDVDLPNINVTCSTGFTGFFTREPFDSEYSPHYEVWSSGVHRLLVLGDQGIFLLLFQTEWLNL